MQVVPVTSASTPAAVLLSRFFRCRSMHCSAVVVTITPEGERTHQLSQFHARLQFSRIGRTSMAALLPG
jgi:hypothetical protein